MNNSEASRYGLPDGAIKKTLLVLADYPGIERVILYGSRAKGNFRPSSDIDLCLHVPTVSLTQQLAIEMRLDDLLFPWRIDLVLAHHISNPSLIPHIERVRVAFHN